MMLLLMVEISQGHDPRFIECSLSAYKAEPLFKKILRNYKLRYLREQSYKLTLEKVFHNFEHWTRRKRRNRDMLANFCLERTYRMKSDVIHTLYDEARSNRIALSF